MGCFRGVANIRKFFACRRYVETQIDNGPIRFRGIWRRLGFTAEPMFAMERIFTAATR